MFFRLPTRVLLRPGAFAHLPETVASAASDAAHVLLVCDAGLRQTPWPGRAEAALQAHGFEVATFDGVEPNPRHTTVDALAEQARDADIDAVVGVGGGSVLDAAKATALLLHNPGSCLAYEGRNRYRQPPAPFVAVPTTCGTGSEVTWVSVITHAAEQRKLSIKGEAMFPTAALVDADLLATLPPSLVAYTGLDALTHALEACTVRVANPISDALAEQAARLLMTYLPRAVEHIADDAEAREAVMRASTLAGMAFGNADVGAVHCLSETIGGIWDVPHGLGNAVFLAPVLRSHLPVLRPRLARLYARIVPEARPSDTDADAERLVEAVECLVADLGVPAFSTLGIPPEAYPRIASGAARNNSNPSNPRPMTEADYLEILSSVE